jgi:hypothetical protein
MQREHKRAISQLEFHEIDIDRGHWERAIGTQFGLLLQSMESLDFDQARDHIKAQANLAEQLGVVDQVEDMIEGETTAVDFLQSLFARLDSQETMSEDEIVCIQKDFVALVEKLPKKSREMADILEIYRKKLAQDSDVNLPHNSAPGVFSGGDGLSAMAQAIFIKHRTKASRSRGYDQKYIRAMWKFLTTLQSLEDAEDGSDEKAIFSRLTELQQLAQDEQYNDIDNDSVQKRREWNTDRLIMTRVSEIRDLIDRDKIEESRMLLERCEGILSLSGDTRPQHRASMDKLAVDLEELHIATLLDPAYAAVRVKDHKTAAPLLKNILTLAEEGTFSRALARNPANLDTLQKVKGNYYQSSICRATEELRWGNALELYSEWRSHGDLWAKLMESERSQAALRLEATCQSMVKLQTFFRALQELDLLQAASLLGEIKASYEGHTTPNAIPSQTTLEYYDNMFKQVLQHLIRDGPEVARDYCSQCLSDMAELGFPIP